MGQKQGCTHRPGDRFAEAFGPAGRQAYIEARLTFDVIWPLVYAFFLITTISWLADRAFRPGSPWRLQDRMSFAAYDRDGNDLQSRGLFLDMSPWQAAAYSWTKGA